MNLSHVSSWGSGTMNDPMIVSRDNPWFEGWYNAPPGRWLSAAGTYSHVYGASPFAGGFVRTWEFSEPGWSAVDDWQTPIRGDVLAGYGGFQTSDELGWLTWAVRAGNLVPGSLYALALANSAGPSASTWYKLDDNVLVVPVVVIAWHTNNIYAGSAATQDYRSRASALFDFIPFRGSRTSNWPTDWLEPSVWPWTNSQADDPTEDYDPPDDVWSQCGIQFQVVRVFSECVGVGGEILPDAKCTECCEVSQIPLIGRFKPLDECPDERVRPDVKCDKVCCSLATPMGNQFQFISRLQCENTFGANIVATISCGNPG